MAELNQSARLVPTLKTRRVVTGHDENGRSIFIEDAACEVGIAVWHPDFVINDVWRLDSLPADNGAYADPCKSVELEGKPTGNVVRIVQFPPDAVYVDAADAAAGFSDMGESGSAAHSQSDDAPHPLMHRTNTIDYIVIIKGEIHAVLEQGEVLLRQGDVLIQRGTNHAWSNRSDEPCILAAILNGAHSAPVAAPVAAGA